MTKPVDVTSQTFELEVLRSEQPVLVDFWAPWCQPCMMLMPSIEAVAGLYAGRLKVVKVSRDDAPELANRFNIRSIPHLMLFKDGEPVAVLGGRNKTRLAAEIDELVE